MYIIAPIATDRRVTDSSWGGGFSGDLTSEPPSSIGRPYPCRSGNTVVQVLAIMESRGFFGPERTAWLNHYNSVPEGILGPISFARDGAGLACRQLSSEATYSFRSFMRLRGESESE